MLWIKELEYAIFDQMTREIDFIFLFLHGVTTLLESFILRVDETRGTLLGAPPFYSVNSHMGMLFVCQPLL